MEGTTLFKRLRTRLTAAAVLASAAQVAIIILMLASSSSLTPSNLVRALPAMAVLTVLVVAVLWAGNGGWLEKLIEFEDTGSAKSSSQSGEVLWQLQQDLVGLPGRLARLSVILWVVCGIMLFTYLPLLAGFYWWEAALVLLLSILGSLIGFVFTYYFAKRSIRDIAAPVLAIETGRLEKRGAVEGLTRKLTASFLGLTTAGTLILLTLFFYQAAIGERSQMIKILSDLRSEWDSRITHPDPALNPEILVVRSSEIFKAKFFLIGADGEILVPAEKPELPGFNPAVFRQQIGRYKNQDYGKPFSIRMGSAEEYIFFRAEPPDGKARPVYIGRPFAWSVLGGWKSRAFAVCALFAVLIILLTWRVVSLSSEDLLLPVNDLLNETRRVAQGELDVSFNIVREDEIGALASGMRIMAKNLREMIARLRAAYQSVEGVISELSTSSGRVAEGSTRQRTEVEATRRSLDDMTVVTDQVSLQTAELSGAIDDGMKRIHELMELIQETAESMEDLNQMVETGSSSILQMAANLKEVAMNTEELSSRSEETSSVMIEMEASIREVENSTRESHKISELVRDHARSGVEAVQSTIQGIGEIEDSVRRAMEMINQLGQSTKQIGKILSVIRDVTNQTNLLALNAAIIASQAGEHGKGFAVVADEIKSLADKTAESTKEIDEIIKRVQSDTRGAVEMMDLGYTNVESGVNLSYLAGEALEKIEKSVGQSLAMVDKITGVTAEQVRSTRRAMEATEEITALIRQIAVSTAEQAKGSDLVLQSSEQIKDITAAVRARTERQSGAAARVQDLMSGLIQLITLLSRSSTTEKEAGGRIIGAMDNIRQITAENETSVARLDENIALLREQAGVLASVLDQFKTG